MNYLDQLSLQNLNAQGYVFSPFQAESATAANYGYALIGATPALFALGFTIGIFAVRYQTLPAVVTEHQLYRTPDLAAATLQTSPVSLNGIKPYVPAVSALYAGTGTARPSRPAGGMIGDYANNTVGATTDFDFTDNPVILAANAVSAVYFCIATTTVNTELDCTIKYAYIPLAWLP